MYITKIKEKTMMKKPDFFKHKSESMVFPSEIKGSSPKLLIPILPLQDVLRRVEVFG